MSRLAGARSESGRQEEPAGQANHDGSVQSLRLAGGIISAFSSDNSAFSAFFSDKSAFSGLNVPPINHKRFRFYEVVDGAPFTQSLVELTGAAKARTTF